MTVSVPRLKMPPPLPAMLVLGEDASARLPLSVEVVTVTVPNLEMPPRCRPSCR